MKLRSGCLVHNKGLKMDSVKETSGQRVEEPTKVDSSNKDPSSQVVASVDNLKDNTSDIMFHSFTSQLNLLKDHMNNKFDSINEQLSCKIDSKVDELKTDIVSNFINFQKEVRLQIESKQKDLLTKLLATKTVASPITVTLEPDNSDIGNNQNDQVVIDLEPSAMENSQNDIPSNNVQDSESSHCASAKLTTPALVTPLKNLSLPSITTDSPDYMRISSTTGSNTVLVSCPVLPGNILQNIPVLTVAPAHSPLPVCSPAVESPVTKPLKILKPKLTTEEFICSGYDVDSEELITTVHPFSAGGKRLSLPGNPRVRTRGGLRRTDTRILSNDQVKDSKNEDISVVKDDANRGGRRGKKSKPFPVIRRQSERLRKGDFNDSPRKNTFYETIGDIEEFIWGNSSDKSTEPTPEKVSEETHLEKSSDTIKETKLNSFKSPSELDSLMQIDNICNTIQNDEAIKKKKVPDCNQTKEKADFASSQKEGSTKKNALVAGSSSCEIKAKSSEKPEETPRNLPAPYRKGLSLSSPRKGNHIRALDFSTPCKKPSPRKANTSPKAISVNHSKLAQLRALRRTNLFKSPMKKQKASWDADLRAFVAPDIPLMSVNMRKRVPFKRNGRSGKFLSPKKMLLIKKGKKKKQEKVLSNNTNVLDDSTVNPEKSNELSNLSKIDGAKTADELVKQIEKDVLEVIAEESSINDIADNSNSANESSASENITDQNEIVVKVTHAETHCSGNDKVSIEKSTSASQISLKNINKTPAKLDFTGLIAANMMTPVSKILKEQSSILENVKFLTPGFLPTPEVSSCRTIDVRKTGTPGPKCNMQNGSSKINVESEQSLNSIKVCPVHIEDALAAEEQAVKPLQSEVTCPSKSKFKTPRKKTSLSLTNKTPNTEKKRKKKKSIEEIIIDQCLKNAEKDLFGKTPKKKSTNENIDKINKNREKPAKSIKDKKTKTNIKSTEKPHVDIILPSFEEMMSRLNKLNHISSDSSDAESDKPKADENRNSLSNDSFPRLRVSEEESICSMSAPHRLKNQPSSFTSVKMAKAPDKPPASKSVPPAIKNSLPKSTNNKMEVVVSPSKMNTRNHQIKDFSLQCLTNSSVENFSYEYYDEGKDGNRTVKASPSICLFEWPMNGKKQTMHLDRFTTNRKSPETCNFDQIKTVQNSTNSPNKVGNSSTQEDKDNSLNSIFKDRKSTRIIRSKSREPRQSLRNSRLALSSHRIRYTERTASSIDRRRSRERNVDSLHKRHKYERMNEYRKTGRHCAGRGFRDRRSKSSERKHYSASLSRVDPRKERDRIHSPNHRSSLEKLDTSEKIRYKELKYSPNKKHNYSDRTTHSVNSKHVNELKNGESKSVNSNRENQYHPLDPRLKYRNRDPHNLNNEKPLAESTPYEKGNVLRESSNPHLGRSHIRKSLHSDLSTNSIEGIQPFQNTPEARYVSTGFKGSSLRKSEEKKLVTNESTVNDCSKNLKHRIVTNITTSCKKSIVESPSSPVVESPESPPRDPRLTSRLYTDMKIQELPLENLALKKKSEDLEEGEISDESCYDAQFYNRRKRKLSDIPEADGTSELK